MQSATLTNLVPTLQTAIGPAILISGVGLLLLSMTNRLGRVIDRARNLAGRLPAVATGDREKMTAQLSILWQRARLIRLAITLASTSALAATVLILVLFFSALWRVDSRWLVGALFVGCMGCLIASLVVFIHDINQSLAALRLELGGANMSDR